MLQSGPLLSVVVPCYNERGTVAELLRRVIAVPISKEIIVVDDCSTDGSFALVQEIAAAEPSIRHLRQEKNSGKGAAVRRGIAEARGEIVLIQDADLEYEPSEYPRLIQPILDGNADAVYGSRFEGYPRRVMMYWHTLGNNVLTWLSNVTTNLNLLQGLPPRRHPVHSHRLEPLRDRAGDHRQARPPRVPDL
jgi:glycosyltransferase involved in cell wall biosynthesis